MRRRFPQTFVVVVVVVVVVVRNVLFQSEKQIQNRTTKEREREYIQS
jgi:preprotein translocase subunit SecG